MTYWRQHMHPRTWIAHVLDQYDEHDNELGGEFRFQGAYGSTLDLQRWEADLCEGCCVALRDWIDAGPGDGTTVVEDVTSGGR